MKIRKKIIMNIILVLIFTCAFMTNTFAGEIKLADTSTMGGIISDADDFLNDGIGQKSEINTDALASGSKTLYNVFAMIGVAVAVIWGIMIGIQFVTGTLGEKADLKKALIPYAVGCVIIFGAFAIWKLALELLEPLAQ